MAARKGKPKATEGTAYTNVLLEQIRSDQRAMIEAMNAWGERLERESRDRFTRVEDKLALLEAAVMQNSRDINRLNGEVTRLNGEVTRLNGEVADLRDEIRRLRSDFDKREDQARITALEDRVAKIEEKLKTA